MTKVYGCPVELALDVLGGKWKSVILARLKQTPMRYAGLRRAVPSLSDKVLTGRLRALEAQGLITRRKDLHYTLTDRGRSLAPALQALFDLGIAMAPIYGAQVATHAAPESGSVVE